MKFDAAVLLAVLASFLVGFSSAYVDNQYWGFAGVYRNREWVSPEGRMSIQSQIPNQSTALDLWPTASTRPQEHSLSEITLQRYLWNDPAMERFNISAMADPIDGAAYRFGVEKGGTGEYRPIIFCFENTVVGQPAICPLKITPTGVYVLVNGTYQHLGYP